MKCLLFVAGIIGSSLIYGGELIDLLREPVLLRGSSFRATASAARTATENYYSAINDGDPKTFWAPMESRGPHFIEMIWNQPVRVLGALWRSEGMREAVLSKWSGGKWIPVSRITEDVGQVRFLEASSDRWRLDVEQFESNLKIYQFGLAGSEQYILPREQTKEFEKGRIVLSCVQLPIEEFQPGGEVPIRFRVASDAVQGPFGLMVELSDRDALLDDDDGDDFVSRRCAVRPDADGWASTVLELPPWTPQGRNDLIVTAFSDATGGQIPIDNPILGSITVSRPGFPSMLEPVSSVMVGENDKGQRGFVINGKWHPAFFNRYYGHPTPERIAATAETGLQILYWQNRQAFPVESESEIQKRLAWFDRRIRMALRVNPQNYFILSQRALPSAQWLKKHPAERMLLESGEPNPENLVSFGSSLYLRQSEQFVTRLIRFVSSQPYAGRVIGYHLWTCTKFDGFIGGSTINRKAKKREAFVLGDYNSEAMGLFRDFLRRKYEGNLGVLRQAWRNETVTFENACVGQEELLREDFVGSPFRDPVRSRPAIDYLEFFPSLISRYLSRTAATIKRESKGKALVLAHLGAIKNSLCNAWAEQLQSNNNDFESVLSDPNIDIFVQAQPYDTREAGNAMHVYQPVKSIDLHGKLYLFDHDPRTLGAGVLAWGRHRSQYEGAAIFARDYGHQWIENSGAWLSDMSLSPKRKFDSYRLPWFTMPEVVDPIRTTIDALKRINVPRRSAAEIAVVLSLNSPRYEDACRMVPAYRGLVNDLLLQDGLPFLGAPYDVILSGDLCASTLPDYKLYVFVNPTYLTGAEKSAIAGLKRGGKTLAWFYAPGYVTDEGLSLSSIQDVTGISIGVVQGSPAVPELRYVGDSVLVQGLNDKRLSAKTWGGLEDFSPASISPLLYAKDDSVTAAGVYSDGRIAYCCRDFGDWKSVWCGVPNYTRADLVNLAKFAGVHLYADAPVVLNADNRMMMLHNGYESNRVIRVSLPSPAWVTDLYTGETVVDGKEFEIKLGKPDTRLLRLDYRK